MENTPTPCAAARSALVLDPFAAIDAHIASRAPAHQAAFAGPVVRDYKPGALVLLFDHYNTGTIVGPGRDRDTWALTTTDADGKVSRFEYRSAWLRPAAEPVEFRWSVS